MQVQLLLDVLTVVGGPVGQVHLVGGGLHHEREGAVGVQVAFAHRAEIGQIDYFAPDASQAFLGRGGRFHRDNRRVICGS